MTINDALCLWTLVLDTGNLLFVYKWIYGVLRVKVFSRLCSILKIHLRYRVKIHYMSYISISIRNQKIFKQYFYTVWIFIIVYCLNFSSQFKLWHFEHSVLNSEVNVLLLNWIIMKISKYFQVCRRLISSTIRRRVIGNRIFCFGT